MISITTLQNYGRMLQFMRANNCYIGQDYYIDSSNSRPPFKVILMTPKAQKLESIIILKYT